MLKRQIGLIISNYELLSLLSVCVPSRWSKSMTLQFPKHLLYAWFYSTRVYRTRYTSDSSSRTNCSKGISYLTFRFGIIHCHYCCSLSSVLSSRIIIYNLLYLLHCVRSKWWKPVRVHAKLYAKARVRVTRENRNELSSRLLREFALVLADFASHALSLMYFICISHLSTKEEVLECRMEDEEPLNHSTIILHVGLPIHYSVITQKTYVFSIP